MRTRRSGRAIDELTPRQREVIALMAKGYTNPEIANELGMTIDGAKWHVREILSKLGVDSREEAALVWRSQRHRLRQMAILLAGGIAAAVVVGFGIWIGASGKSPKAPLVASLTSTSTANALAIATSSVPAFGVSNGKPITLNDASARLPVSEGDPQAAYDGELIVQSSVHHFDQNARPHDTYDETFRLWNPATGKFTPLWTTMGSVATERITSIDGDWAAVLGTWGDDASIWKISLHNLRTGEMRNIAQQSAAHLDGGPMVGGVVAGGHLFWSQVVPVNGVKEQQLESYSIADGTTTTAVHSGPLGFAPTGTIAPDDTLAGPPVAGGGRVAWVTDPGSSGERAIALLAVASGVITHPVKALQIAGIALSADGRYLAWTDTAQIWALDLTTGKQVSVVLGDAPAWSGDRLWWYARGGNIGFYSATTNTLRLVVQPPNTGTNVGQVMGNWFVWQIMPLDGNNAAYWAIVPIK